MVVRPGKVDAFNESQPHQGNSQKPCSLDSGRAHCRGKSDSRQTVPKKRDRGPKTGPPHRSYESRTNGPYTVSRPRHRAGSGPTASGPSRPATETSAVTVTRWKQHFLAAGVDGLDSRHLGAAGPGLVVFESRATYTTGSCPSRRKHPMRETKDILAKYLCDFVIIDSRMVSQMLSNRVIQFTITAHSR